MRHSFSFLSIKVNLNPTFPVIWFNWFLTRWWADFPNRLMPNWIGNPRAYDLTSLSEKNLFKLLLLNISYFWVDFLWNVFLVGKLLCITGILYFLYDLLERAKCPPNIWQNNLVPSIFTPSSSYELPFFSFVVVEVVNLCNRTSSFRKVGMFKSLDRMRNTRGRECTSAPYCCLFIDSSSLGN